MTYLWKRYLQASLILRVTIALVMGVLVGIVGGDWVAVWLAPLGDLLLRLLTFLIVPIVLFTLMVGVNQSREGSAGRVGGKVFIYYLASSAFAIVVGLLPAAFHVIPLFLFTQLLTLLVCELVPASLMP